MKTILTSFLIFFATTVVLSQDITLNWAGQYAGNVIVRTNEMVVDGNSNVYTIGRFTGAVDVDPGVTNYSFTSSGGLYTPYVCKLDAWGNFVWGAQFAITTVINT